MNWERQPAENEPVMEQRTFHDDQGRQWTGMVTSGRFEGGEASAEVIFVCDDQPSETKRVANLGIDPAHADQAFRTMAERDVRELFRNSSPA